MADGNAEVGSYLALEVVRRLAHFQVASWANQYEHVRRAVDKVEPLLSVQGVSVLCLAEAIKDVPTGSTRDDGPSACMQPAPAKDALVPQAPDTTITEGKQLLQQMLKPDSPVVIMKGIPKTWDASTVGTMLKGAGLCMHCDVDKVEMGTDEARVHVNTNETARKCLELDGVLVQHLLGHWPLSVTLHKPLEEPDHAMKLEIQNECKREDSFSPSPERILAQQLKADDCEPNELGLLKALLSQEQRKTAGIEPGLQRAPSETLTECETSIVDDAHGSLQTEATHSDDHTGSPTSQVAEVPERSERLPPKRSRGRKPKNCPAEACAVVTNSEGVSVTTFVITKIPKNCRLQALTHALRKLGFHGTFDFVYFPYDFETHQSKGYAFVNFKNSSTAAIFPSTFGGTRLCPNTQGVGVLPADVQGLGENVRAFFRKRQRKQIRQMHCLPLVFLTDDPEGVPLSKEHLPTKFWRDHDVQVCLEE